MAPDTSVTSSDLVTMSSLIMNGDMEALIVSHLWTNVDDDLYTHIQDFFSHVDFPSFLKSSIL